MTIDEIKKIYINVAVKFGSSFLLRPKDALSFIDNCVSNGYILEGVEGFSITRNNAFQPDQEHSNDFIDLSCSREEFVRITIEFISERVDRNILFDVVFSEKRENV